MGKDVIGENPGFILNMTMAQTVVTLSELITYPIDTTRRRMMMQAGKKKSKQLYKNSLVCFRKILKKEGFKALFHGAYSNFVRSIASALVLVLYDDLKKTLGIVDTH